MKINKYKKLILVSTPFVVILAILVAVMGAPFWLFCMILLWACIQLVFFGFKVCEEK